LPLAKEEIGFDIASWSIIYDTTAQENVLLITLGFHRCGDDPLRTGFRSQAQTQLRVAALEMTNADVAADDIFLTAAAFVDPTPTVLMPDDTYAILARAIEVLNTGQNVFDLIQRTNSFEQVSPLRPTVSAATSIFDPMCVCWTLLVQLVLNPFDGTLPSEIGKDVVEPMDKEGAQSLVTTARILIAVVVC
jgi:hypothetical protein